MELRARFRGRATKAQVALAVTLEPAGDGGKHGAGGHAAGGHAPEEAVLRATLRRPKARLAELVVVLDAQLAAGEAQLGAVVAAWMPELLAEYGVGPVTAAMLLVAWSHPGRCRSEAAFAMLAGAAPQDACPWRRRRGGPPATG